jgi:non-specific serine/threonine protein kinase
VSNLHPPDPAERARTVATLRRALGQAAFAAAWAAGEALSLEQAADLALSPEGEGQPGGGRGGGDGGLTPRQREVAALVARGLSNRQVAAALTIAERTAENHVEHILGKLGFRSRAQVAAWMARQGAGAAGPAAPPGRPARRAP